jgi:hypothetical protein
MRSCDNSAACVDALVVHVEAFEGTRRRVRRAFGLIEVAIEARLQGILRLMGRQSERTERDREQHTMSDAVRKPGRIIWANVITVLSAAILVGTITIGTGLATGWAIAGLFGLGNAAALTLESVFAVLAVGIVYAFVRAAMRVEPFVDR